MSSRVVFILGSMVASSLASGGCATAGSGQDTPPRVDAAPSVDAPPNLIDGPPVSDCMTAETCQGATSLGSVSGDDGNDKFPAMGYRAAWFRVRVTEDDHGLFGVSLRAAAKLTSPPGTEFGVFIYVNQGSDQLECSTTMGNPSTNGSIKTVRGEWGDSRGDDDGRDMSIEIRPLSGACSPGAMWQLEVEGNWL
jgi:hypothetical protein